MDAGVRAGLFDDRYQLEALVNATVHIEAAANRDGSVVWIARGTAAGVPYIAEADSEDAAAAAACALLYQRHAARTAKQREQAEREAINGRQTAIR